MADSLNKMIHMAHQLKRHADNMSKDKTSGGFWRLQTGKFAEAIQDRLLKGIAEGYDINGKQFKHHSKFTTFIRKREALGGKSRTTQFGGDEEAYEQAAALEGISSAKPTKITATQGGYNFDGGPNGTILYDGKNPGNDIITRIGRILDNNDLIISEKTSIKLKADRLRPYQKLQNYGGEVPSSGFSTKFNVSGKRIPKREFFGIPKTYQENHPGWKEAMGVMVDELYEEYGRIIEGGKANLEWYKKSKEGNKKWQALKKKAK